MFGIAAYQVIKNLCDEVFFFLIKVLKIPFWMILSFFRKNLTFKVTKLLAVTDLTDILKLSIAVAAILEMCLFPYFCFQTQLGNN